MASLRKGKCYTNVTRPYTRKSKVAKRNYIRSVPQSKLVKFDMGNSKKEYTHKVSLVSKQDIQVRHNALESTRQIVNRHIMQLTGAKPYYMKILSYPHHVLRENRMLSGAHADRLQTGMAHSFGSPAGIAARLKKGKSVIVIFVNANNVESAKIALKFAYPRMPGKYTVNIEEIKK
jgi:large subunit ribosomal protein L10e